MSSGFLNVTGSHGQGLDLADDEGVWTLGVIRRLGTGQRQARGTIHIDVVRGTLVPDVIVVC